MGERKENGQEDEAQTLEEGGSEEKGVGKMLAALGKEDQGVQEIPGGEDGGEGGGYRGARGGGAAVGVGRTPS